MIGLCGDSNAQDPAAQPIRIGMIGLDTSHVPAFVGIFNNAKATGDLAGFKVVAGYSGGTDLPASRDRVERFTEQIRAKGIEIVDSISALLEKHHWTHPRCRHLGALLALDRHAGRRFAPTIRTLPAVELPRLHRGQLPHGAGAAIRVDPTRIAVMGHSYGGKGEMFASCLY